MQPTSSHEPTRKPSALLAVVCLAIVHRLRPEWTAVPLAVAAAEVGVRPERLSRLATRSVHAFESVLTTLTRLGRPKADRPAVRESSERRLRDALLEVASAILRQVSLRRALFRDLVVGCYERLMALHPTLTANRFAEFLGISARTLRDWRRRSTRKPARSLATDPLLKATPPPSASESTPKGFRGRTRRPRFGFDVTLPDTQYSGDTTDLAVFGVPLKLMAAQDIGGRDLDLLDGAVIDTHESSEHISRLLQSVLSSDGGDQVQTDQGTPFMASSVAAALDEARAEHAPQVEGDPCGKATIERAFRTVKDIARPLFDLTNRLASAFPALVKPELAKSAASLVVAFLLRAYQAGARAAWRSCRVRGNIDIETLARAAEESRERARVVDESARLLLTRVHETLGIPGGVAAFIRRFRSFPITVLQRAEQGFAAQAHRGDIENRLAYFASLIHRFYADHTGILERQRVRDREIRRARQDRLELEAIRARRNADPAACLFEGLQFLACQWLPTRGELLFGGIGAGKGLMLAALRRLIELHGLQPALDIARGVLQGFLQSPPPGVPPEALPSIASVTEQIMAEFPTPDPTPDFTPRIASSILHRPGSKTRPGPSPPLRT